VLGRLQVPFDALKRDARDRKAIIESIQRATAKLSKAPVSQENAKAALEELKHELVKLKGLVRSMQEFKQFAEPGIN
jgi:transposase